MCVSFVSAGIEYLRISLETMTIPAEHLSDGIESHLIRDYNNECDPIRF